MAQPKNWILAYTVAAYAGGLVAFGSAVFTVNLASCSGVISCTGAGFTLLGELLDFLITLGAFTAGTPPLLTGLHLLVMALGWGTYVADLVAEAV